MARSPSYAGRGRGVPDEVGSNADAVISRVYERDPPMHGSVMAAGREGTVYHLAAADEIDTTMTSLRVLVHVSPYGNLYMREVADLLCRGFDDLGVENAI